MIAYDMVVEHEEAAVYVRTRVSANMINPIPNIESEYTSSPTSKLDWKPIDASYNVI